MKKFLPGILLLLTVISLICCNFNEESSDSGEKDPPATGPAYIEEEIDVVTGATTKVNNSTYHFGNYDIADGQTVKSFDIKNSGSQSVTISGIALSDETDFELSGLPSLPATIGSGETISFSLTYKALTYGEQISLLTISDDKGNSFKINLKGRLAAPSSEAEIKVSIDNEMNSGDTYDFGTFIKGNTVSPKSVKISNVGLTDLIISGVTLTGTGNFSLSGATGSTTVSSGNSITFDINTNTVNAGDFSDTVSINSNDADEGVFAIPLESKVEEGDYEITLDFESNGSYLVYACWIEDESGNNIQNFYICNSILGIGKTLTGDAIPNWLTKKYIQNNDVDTVTGASVGNSSSNKHLNITRIYNSAVTVRKFRVCFEVDRSRNYNTYFDSDRPSFIYRTDLIDLDTSDLSLEYNLTLYGWMSNDTTGYYGQQPNVTIPGFAQYTLMTGAANLQYIEAGGLDPMVTSLKVTVAKK